jgi:hypothetical protein
MSDQNEKYQTNAHSFDELARGLATGTISRGQALKLVGATALSTALMPLFPDTAQALTSRQRRRCRQQGGTVCGEGRRRSQICCPAGRPCCGTARQPECCPSGGQCVDSGCQCPSGETECSGACIDLNTDESNCGFCFNRCPTGASCVDGSCECPSTTDTVCNGQCVSTTCPEGQTFHYNLCRCVEAEAGCTDYIRFCGSGGPRCGTPAPNTNCVCTASLEGPIRCGRNFGCGSTPLCRSSAECEAALGPGSFCQAPNTGCCGQHCVPACGSAAATLSASSTGKTNSGLLR